MSKTGDDSNFDENCANARVHSELIHEFQIIEIDIINAGEHDFKEKDIVIWEKKISDLEPKEPPQIDALVIECQNELRSTTYKTQ